MLSPTALETKLIASYDAGSDASLLPTLSPASQTSRLGYASPSRDGRPFSRVLLSPPRTGGKVSDGSGARRAWSSPSAHGPAATLGSHASSSDSREVSKLSHSPPSPLSQGRGGGGRGMPHLREKEWASPAKGGGGGGRDKTGVKCERAAGGMPTPIKSPRSRDWKTAVDDSEQRFFAAAAAHARDMATTITPGEAREMTNRSTRAKEERQSTSSRSDTFESWDRERAGSWGGDARNAAARSEDRQTTRGRRSCWSRDNEREEEAGRGTALTPSDGGERNPRYSRTPSAPSHTTPSPATSRGETDSDDTLLAAASLVSFQKPRVAEAPRLKGPLGTSALRVTLGTPVVSSGASISSSVQAKLSLPRTTPTPSYPSLASEMSGTFAKGSADPMETAYRAAGLAVGSCGGVESEGRGKGSGRATKAVKSEPPLPKSARNGMFDAVSPTAPAQESGTPYSVCRVDRSGRPYTNPAAASTDQDKGHGSRDAQVGELKKAPSGDSAAMTADGAHGSVEPLCHTPRKPAFAGREGAPAFESPAARPRGWSGSGGGPWATPPPIAMGTPCSGSRFRSADDEESDYSDYETVRTRVTAGLVVFFFLLQWGWEAGGVSYLAHDNSSGWCM